jgi:multimeric flavodoxin WrbA
MKHILILNGSPSGIGGNTAIIGNRVSSILAQLGFKSSIATLSTESYQDLVPRISKSSAFVFASGTYWESWGSPLQRFFEEATASEGSELWLGKPAAVAISMHAVGGQGVLSRLQGVLSTYGLFIPPMSGLVLSYVNQLALTNCDAALTEDLWRAEDLEVALHNLTQALTPNPQWRTWPRDSVDFEKRWVRV